MTEEQAPAASTLEGALARLNNAQLLVGALVLQILPLLLALNIATPAARLLALAVAISIVVAAYLLVRTRARRKAAAELRERSRNDWEKAHLQAAFRGLYSYTRRDKLPGDKRQTLARSIATQVANPTFRYGLVSGEVGAGKSSLLDSGVCAQLEKADFDVLLVRGLQEFGGERSLQVVIARMRGLLEELERERVLVIDQFEEMLIEWPSRPSRQKLGAFLRKPLADRLVRVICTVRSDYILAMHDLAPALPDPTSARSMFPVNNLDQQEAAEIILECSNRDRMGIGRDLAMTIAADLSHGGRVRPPELQLVCQGLSGSEPEKSYRAGGGAQGILSDHTKKAIESSLNADLARSALRALCNFEATPATKKPPQTLGEVADAIGFASRGLGKSDRLSDVMRHLSDAGLVKSIGGSGTLTYALVHDYLVQPVVHATSDASTQAEKANQLLKLHLAEYDADPRSRIPLRRLRFIGRHADREMLASARGKGLLRLSYWSAGVRSAAAAGLAAIAMVVIVSWQGFAVHWGERTLMGKHDPNRSSSGLSFVATEDGREIFSSEAVNRASWWDARTGQSLWSEEGSVAAINNSHDMLLVAIGNESQPDEQREVRLVRRALLSGGRVAHAPTVSPTPFDASYHDFAFSANGQAISAELINRVTLGTRENQIRVWSIARRRMLWSKSLSGFVVSSSTSGTGRNVFITYADLSRGSEENRAQMRSLLLSESGERELPSNSEWVVNSNGRFALTLVRGLGEQAILELWDAEAARPIARRSVGSGLVVNPQFSVSGRYVVVSHLGQLAGAMRERALIFEASNHLQPRRVPTRAEEVKIVGDDNSVTHLRWAESNGRTVFWDIESGRLARVEIDSDEIVEIGFSRNRAHATIRTRNGDLALFDTGTWRRRRLPSLPEGVAEVAFTADNQALGVATAGGAYTLIEIASGALIGTFSDLSNVAAAYYDRRCERAHFWTRQGMVFRYTRGRRLPFVGFWPRRNCA